MYIHNVVYIKTALLFHPATNCFCMKELGLHPGELNLQNGFKNEIFFLSRPPGLPFHQF